MSLSRTQEDESIQVPNCKGEEAVPLVSPKSCDCVPVAHRSTLEDPSKLMKLQHVQTEPEDKDIHVQEDESIRVPNGKEEETAPLVPLDSVLVAVKSTQEESRKLMKQQQVQTKLEDKNVHVQEDESTWFMIDSRHGVPRVEINIQESLKQCNCIQMADGSTKEYPGKLMKQQHGQTELEDKKVHSNETFDYILVADRINKVYSKNKRKQKQAEQRKEKQKQFKKELEDMFNVKVVKDQDKVFYGIRTKDSIFKEYQMLLMEKHKDKVSHGIMEPNRDAHRTELDSPASTLPETTQIRIADFFLENKMSDGETFETLMKAGVFETRFPLHKKTKLKDSWAQWKNVSQYQPIDDIRDYFGEKVALYFTWLGWYTYMLLPAALMGLGVFLFGFRHFKASQISKEICEAHEIYMCPLGDHSRSYHRLSDTCSFAKLTHLFDNEGTVFFAFFMALWSTVFVEGWERYRVQVTKKWKIYDWDEDQEKIALELILKKQRKKGKHSYKKNLKKPSYLSKFIILLVVVFMICILIGMAYVMVVYRIMATAAFGYLALPFLEDQVTTAVVVTGALVHYLMIIIMTKVNHYVALRLCELEDSRTYSEQEKLFTVKFFTLQFFVNFSSLFYVAFILGRINGHPGKSVRLAGMWKLEECHLSGCMMDLFTQMFIIMSLKQIFSNLVEYLKPLLHHKKHARWDSEDQSKDSVVQDWRRNLSLSPVDTYTLFNEFMEMMIQYGFTTIFVAAFPLAPLLAFINNVLEIRLDAIKMLRLQRRLVPRKTKDIKTWLQVLKVIGVLAVIVNGMIIAFTSEFVPRLVYKYHYGPCGQRAVPGVDCFKGYINYSLSVFYTKDFPDASSIRGPQNVTECRYRDYRNPKDYSLSEQFWVLLAIRLGFLILFEHVALCIKFVVAWFVRGVLVKNIIWKAKKKMLEKKQAAISESGPRTPATPVPNQFSRAHLWREILDPTPKPQSAEGSLRARRGLESRC